MAAALGELARFAYFVPSAMGAGKHWELAEYEARMMGRALEGAVKALPGKSKVNTVRVLSRWLPWISLITTSYIVTMPRVMTSFGGGFKFGRRPAAPGANGPLRDAGRESEAPAGADGSIPTWEDYSRRFR